MTDENKNIIIGGHNVICYSSRKACEERIKELKNKPYLLSPGEESRPILSAHNAYRERESRWYVYAVYNYSPDVEVFRSDGPFEIIIPHESDKELSIRHKGKHR